MISVYRAPPLPGQRGGPPPRPPAVGPPSVPGPKSPAGSAALPPCRRESPHHGPATPAWQGKPAPYPPLGGTGADRLAPHCLFAPGPDAFDLLLQGRAPSTPGSFEPGKTSPGRLPSWFGCLVKASQAPPGGRRLSPPGACPAPPLSGPGHTSGPFGPPNRRQFGRPPPGAGSPGVCPTSVTPTGPGLPAGWPARPGSG